MDNYTSITTSGVAQKVGIALFKQRLQKFCTCIPPVHPVMKWYHMFANAVVLLLSILAFVPFSAEAFQVWWMSYISGTWGIIYAVVSFPMIYPFPMSQVNWPVVKHLHSNFAIRATAMIICCIPLCFVLMTVLGAVMVIIGALPYYVGWLRDEKITAE